MKSNAERDGEYLRPASAVEWEGDGRTQEIMLRGPHRKKTKENDYETLGRTVPEGNRQRSERF